MIRLIVVSQAVHPGTYQTENHARSWDISLPELEEWLKPDKSGYGSVALTYELLPKIVERNIPDEDGGL